MGGVDQYENTWPRAEGILYWRSKSRVTDVADGLTALERYALERPDLVLLDVTMAGMDGLEVLHQLRQHLGGVADQADRQGLPPLLRLQNARQCLVQVEGHAVDVAGVQALLDAVVTSCRIRLRPILMTSLATIIGLVPMALKLGTGSEAYAPLARAIIGGLIVSVALTVFIVPAAYLIVYRRRQAVVIGGGAR